MLKVSMCLGTTCYVLGAKSLQEIEEVVSDNYQGKVEIERKNCLEYCDKADSSVLKAPYVLVGDKLISEASADKVIQAIENCLRENNDE